MNRTKKLMTLLLAMFANMYARTSKNIKKHQK